jgi:hypothetical protein
MCPNWCITLDKTRCLRACSAFEDSCESTTAETLKLSSKFSMCCLYLVSRSRIEWSKSANSTDVKGVATLAEADKGIVRTLGRRGAVGFAEGTPEEGIRSVGTDEILPTTGLFDVALGDRARITMEGVTLCLDPPYMEAATAAAASVYGEIH